MHRIAIRLTSSSRLGKIFLLFSLSEKPGNTRNSPFRKDAFSSLGLLAKFEESKKFRVEIANEEK
jgi:hypothetical protein